MTIDRTDAQALRSMRTDIYPPDLQGPGLRDAVQQLVQTEALRAGLAADVRIDEDLSIPLDAGRLAYRVVREAIRNVVRHAAASTSSSSWERPVGTSWCASSTTDETWTWIPA